MVMIRPDLSTGKTPSSATPDPPEVKQGDPTVLVNGKPVTRPAEEENKSKSGATKEAAAAKVAEQKLSGQAQEVKVRSQYDDLKNQTPNVLINSKAANRQDDRSIECEGQGTVKEKK